MEHNIGKSSRNFNKKTDSYYTEEEYEILTQLGFKWSNRSCDDNNALYQYKNGISYEIIARTSGLTFEKRVATIFDTLDTTNYNLTLEEVIQQFNTNTFKEQILLSSSITITFLVCAMTIILQTLLVISPFNVCNTKKEGFKFLKENVYNFFLNKKMYYHTIRDAMPFSWGLIAIIVGVCIGAMFF